MHYSHMNSGICSMHAMSQPTFSTTAAFSCTQRHCNSQACSSQWQGAAGHCCVLQSCVGHALPNQMELDIHELEPTATDNQRQPATNKSRAETREVHNMRTCSLQAVHANTDSMHTAAACWLLCLEPCRTISELQHER